MGTWGTQPWENDAAADWFSDLFAETGLDGFILNTLRQEPVNNRDEILAATFVLSRLAEVHIWPLTSLEECLKLAEKNLVELLSHVALTSDTELHLRQVRQRLLEDIRNALAKLQLHG